MTDFRRDVVRRGSPGAHSKAAGPARAGEGCMPGQLVAQPGTMLAAIAAREAVGDFARARTVQALLSEQA